MKTESYQHDFSRAQVVGNGEHVVRELLGSKSRAGRLGAAVAPKIHQNQAETVGRQPPKHPVPEWSRAAAAPSVQEEHRPRSFVAVNPEGGKMARAQAVSPQVESGNVYLPHPALAAWVEELIEETAAFPHGRNDDQVDAMTQALNRLRNTSASYVVPEAQITEGHFGRCAM